MIDSFDPAADGPLSPEGEARRVEILHLAQGQARARRHRRAMRRAVGSVVGGGAAVLLFFALYTRQHPRVLPQVVVNPPASRDTKVASVPTRSRPEIVITRIPTDATLASQWAVRLEKPAWQKLTDDDLLRRLQEAGRPAGLAYVDGQARILFREPVRR